MHYKFTTVSHRVMQFSPKCPYNYLIRQKRQCLNNAIKYFFCVKASELLKYINFAYIFKGKNKVCNKYTSQN